MVKTYTRPVVYMPPGETIEGSTDKLFRAVIDGRQALEMRPGRAWFIGLRFYPKDPAVVVQSIVTKEQGELLVMAVKALELEAAFDEGVWESSRVGVETVIEVRVSGPCDTVGFCIRYEWEVETSNMTDEKLTRAELLERGHWIRDRAFAVSTELLDVLLKSQSVAPPWGDGGGGVGGLAVMSLGVAVGRYLAMRSDESRPAAVLVDTIWAEMRDVVVDTVTIERGRR